MKRLILVFLAVYILSQPNNIQVLPANASVLQYKELSSLPPVKLALVYEQKTADIPAILQRIAVCESGDKQFNEKGEVLRGKVNPLDTGRFQINRKYHQRQASKLGYNLETWEGNTSYALWLYGREGVKPWLWSVKCWFVK